MTRHTSFNETSRLRSSEEIKSYSKNGFTVDVDSYNILCMHWINKSWMFIYVLRNLQIY